LKLGTKIKAAYEDHIQRAQSNDIPNPQEELKKIHEKRLMNDLNIVKEFKLRELDYQLTHKPQSKVQMLLNSGKRAKTEDTLPD